MVVMAFTKCIMDVVAAVANIAEAVVAAAIGVIVEAKADIVVDAEDTAVIEVEETASAVGEAGVASEAVVAAGMDLVAMHPHSASHEAICTRPLSNPALVAVLCIA